MKSGSHDTDGQERLQRIRIGITGLVAVVLVVLSAGALIRAASDEPPVAEQANVMAPSGLPDIVGENPANEDWPREALVELGVAPSTTPAENGADQPVKGKGP